jgi:hypothetical protein
VAPPPEVLLDRFLKSSLRSRMDRERYIGKQDLARLELGLGSLLTNVQDALNEALRQRGNVFAKGRCPNFHFDYVDATVSNALAFEHEGYAFIVITMPLIRVLWHTCDQLSRSTEVMAILGSLPTTDQRREAAIAVLFTTQLTFVVSHEFGHHDRGHFGPAASASDTWSEIPAAGTTGSLEQQAREIDADGWAVYLVLTHLMIGDRREACRVLLGLQATPEESVDQTLLSSFILAVAAVLFVFPPTVFDNHTLYQLVHPPQAARMNEIVHNVRTWCGRNRPALGAWMTLECFQALMRAARATTSELNGALDWSRQTEFFLTQAGAEYFRSLHQHVVSLMDHQGPATEVATD